MVFPRRGYQSGRGVETVDCGPWTVGVPKGTRSGNRLVFRRRWGGTKLCPLWSGQKMSIFVGHEWTFLPRAARGALCSEVCITFFRQVYWIFNPRSKSGKGYQIVSILEWTKNVHFRWAQMDIFAASSEGCTVQRGLHFPFLEGWLKSNGRVV